jgi:PilZ domain-containing protein
LSEGGLCLEIAGQVKINETLSVFFKLPDGVPVNASAKVCWNKGLRSGLQFVSIASAHKTAIVEWLEKQFAERLVMWNPAWNFTTAQVKNSAAAAV